jgi:hypothetical protein
MIEIEIDVRQLERLQKAVERSKKKFPKELALAINAVSKKTRLQIGRDIRATVAMPKAESEKPLSIRGKATEQNLTATVTLRKTKRLGLRHFGAKQDQRGVSYKIAKQGGRKRVNSGFQGPKPGVMKVSWKGNAFKRVGKARLPIIKLQGVSAYGAYAKNELSGPQVEAINAELTKQMERRIKLNILRAEGLVAK